MTDGGIKAIGRTSMTKDEALKLALEALVLNNAEWKHLADSGDSGDWSAEDQDHYKQTEEAITAIKEALAQPEQEPVAKVVSTAPERIWLDLGFDPSDEDEISFDDLIDATWSHDNATGYGIEYVRADTTPPQHTWVGLTEAQCGVLWKTNMTPFEYYQAIEAKLKENK